MPLNQSARSTGIYHSTHSFVRSLRPFKNKVSRIFKTNKHETAHPLVSTAAARLSIQAHSRAAPSPPCRLQPGPAAPRCQRDPLSGPAHPEGPRRPPEGTERGRKFPSGPRLPSPPASPPARPRRRPPTGCPRGAPTHPARSEAASRPPSVKAGGGGWASAARSQQNFMRHPRRGQRRGGAGGASAGTRMCAKGGGNRGGGTARAG